MASVADPGCLFRIPIFSVPDPNFFHPGSRTRIKEFKYVSPKKLFLSSRKYDPDCSSRIRILIFYPSLIQGSQRHRIPDPGSGSATLPMALVFSYEPKGPLFNFFMCLVSAAAGECARFRVYFCGFLQDCRPARGLHG